MYLEQLSILNYRNIEECDLHFSKKINCFLSDNGMGKTNLLDAIYYLSFCKSHLNPIDNQTIRHDADFFMIQGNYTFPQSREQITCSVKRRRKKQFLRNKKEYERLSDHIGFIPLVLVSPTDTSLIEEGSDERRRFMDMVIAQYDKTYLETLIHYNTLLKNRNALLKSESLPEEAVLTILEEQMQVKGEILFASRKRFIEQFTPVFQNFYNRITDEQETVSLRYTSHFQQGNLSDLLYQVRDRDRILGYTTRGSHKDDIEMLLGDYPIKRTGSQGQNKSFLIAMKLAQFVFLKQMSSTTPLLLLDDLFDKLDAKRVKRIIELVASDDFGQIFITDTNREHLDHLLSEIDSEAMLFGVNNGIVELLKH